MSQYLSNEQLTQIADTYGTPVYVYHAEKITEQYNRLTTAFANADTRFFYACKALTNSNILRHIRSLGCGVDCSSINEVKLALRAGFDPNNVLYTSNGIAFSEIAEAVELGVNVNIDSLSNLEKFGRRYGSSYPVGIRLRPNIMAGGNLKISTGHEKSKFGIPIEQLNGILDLMAQYHIVIKGLHIHTGSEIKDVDVFMKVADIFSELVPHFKDLVFLDMGGGFKVPYREGESGTDMTLLGEKVAAALQQLEAATGRHFQAWFEPGKFLVSESGYFITQVNVLKENAATTFAGVNSGFNHLIRPMFYEAYHRISNISNPQGALKHYTVTGNICETDTFAWDRELNEVREGDLLVFYNAGAYGFEMGSNYNARFRPAQVLVKNGEAQLIRRRDDFEDLLRNEIDVI
ncbi:diaminopimelate decarboxylase [Sediminibacterium ginsengisoli]|uniref:Diaminopimelate decarboxylase n=1 Tax=Sediminibacterium ginsengisoli TaxID=413434 RepID=A0A1T4KAV7_9BACT|nr:diaminopimelate decarboxylase [Sediminibacterium ginsengisoli]SJZ39507.1 diaminopimelate decarboxylase [Sediminibacterium ginsengisoli]